jgi:hypothetical protein
MAVTVNSWIRDEWARLDRLGKHNKQVLETDLADTLVP